MSGPERMYTVDEAAETLRVHPKTLRRWLKAGTVPHVRVGPSRLVRFTESQLSGICNDVIPATTVEPPQQSGSFRERVRAWEIADDVA